MTAKHTGIIKLKILACGHPHEPTPPAPHLCESPLWMPPRIK